MNIKKGFKVADIMEEELKILILEDVRFDVELMEYELRREGIKFISKQVETEEEFIKGINEFNADIILADHSLPAFDGVSALEIAKKIAPGVPFIFVSGKIGEEFAVEMLKKGATDYVLKNNLTKLVPAVKRALTERNELIELRKNKKQLQKALIEKEMLLKEIHHRVKNNLIIISNLLELQSHYIEDKTDFNFFRESQNRANSMALIHERLYQSTDLKRVDFGEYVHTLATDLLEAYTVAPDQIELVIDVENIMLDIDTAIPLGLILNELLTNSLKYAFPAVTSVSLTKTDIINVTFNKIGDTFVLIVKDNGIGFPQDLDYKKTGTLGLELVNRITKQINGILELNVSEGTEFKITFKELKISGGI